MKRKKNKTRTAIPKRHRRRRSNRRFQAPKTAEEFFGLPQKLQDLWIKINEVPTKARAKGMSVYKASSEVGIDPRIVLRHARSAFRKSRNGRYVAKGYDRLLRVIRVVSTNGLQEVATRDSRQATKAGKHSAWVDHYLRTGDASRVPEFDGQEIVDLNGNRFTLLTDLDEIDRLGSAGEFSFETLYARSA
jgi:hypothetical protein